MQKLQLAGKGRYDRATIILRMKNFQILRSLFQKPNTTVSIITRLEVLGYHKITPKQIIYFDAVFKLLENIPITENVISEAINYRQLKSMSVADSIIAATAKLYQYVLYTNNVSDFKNIQDFKIINPLDSFRIRKAMGNKTIRFAAIV